MKASDQEQVRNADFQNYQEADLIELKIALHLPYYTGSGDYERIDGEIKIDGVHYNYVKRRISNDTLFVMCLPNEAKTRLYVSMLQFTGQALDLADPHHPEKPGLKKHNILSDYDYNHNSYNLIAPGSLGSELTTFRVFSLLTPPLCEIYSPPRLIA